MLFDADGVLVNSYEVYHRVWGCWASNHELDNHVVWAGTHARRPTETVAEVAPHLDPEHEYEKLKALLATEERRTSLYPGAADLLHSLPIGRWAIVTSGREAVVRSRLRTGGAPEPTLVVDGAAVREGKPSPEGYLLAAHRLGTPPSACLVVEDAPLGIRAGRAAGMQVLAIGSTHHHSHLADASDIRPTLQAAARLLQAWVRK